MVNYIFISILSIVLAIWVQFAMRWIFSLLLSNKDSNSEPESVQTEDTVMVVYNGQNQKKKQDFKESADQDLEKVV